MTSPADSIATARGILRRVGQQPDDQIDLAEAALALGALDRPEADLDEYRRHVATLAADLAARVPPQGEDGLEARAALLREVIIERHGYSGDHETYDDLQNANLLRVIDRRRGLPVALGILFLHAARAQGWRMVGLNFPGHFLVRLDAGPQRAILDPFNEGQMRSPAELRDLLKATAGVEAELSPDHYQPVSNRDVLLRLQNNIKLRHLSAHDVAKALEVLEAMRLFAPDEPALWRETGLLEAHSGNLASAIDSLETFMDLTDDERHRYQTASLIQQLKQRLN
ncbi:SirB1 family protein [Azospirillum thermophilum]|uniref:SirB1 family protein n=1 Tax=Azospirillum thermophilum TaxID=2202148 RepID=UPI001FE494AD|nr:transglutaminase-like domain-containing protein [Azospirillum thermophilum]